MSVDQMSLFTALLALVALGIASAVGVFLCSTGGRRRLEVLRTDALRLAFSIAVVSTVASLWFSEVGGFVPCEFCWYQRIAMYPLVVLLGLAVWRGDSDLRWRVLPLSVTGLGLSAYHYQRQMYPNLGASCDVVAPCTQQASPTRAAAAAAQRTTANVPAALASWT